MKKLADFIVSKHKLVLAAVIVLAVFCAGLIPKVQINTDMTKYLPDDSVMKQGIDIMMDNFSNMATSQTIRVMFKDVPQSNANDIKNVLASIQYVDSVTYVANSSDYNKDGYMKFVVNTSYTYGSPEELYIEDAIEKSFAAYNMEFMNDNTSSMEMPWAMIAVAIILLFAILFVMSGSWFEPVLFMVTIGIAVAMNMGTNIFLGSVSQITISIAAILQLVLSMDYSIILMNRYRQEKKKFDNNEDAMKSAWRGAFSSVTSSGMTTVIGLLVLIFMSFKIGMDLGIVLAKGVLFSMICVLTILPALILIFDSLIEKTEKKELHIPMGALSRIQYKGRKGIAVFFVILFIVSIFGQNLTQTVFSLSPEDPIAEVFTPSNPIIALYKNEDEQKMSEIAEQLSEDISVKNVMSYSTTLGKKFTSQGMVDMILDMGIPLSIDPSLIDLIYYSYYGDGKLIDMTVTEVIDFVSTNIISNPMFSSYIGNDVKTSIEGVKQFTDPKALTTPLNADELAKNFGLNANDLKQLFVLYYSKNSGANYGKMTLSQFADFVVNDVATNEMYSSMFDEETKSQIAMLTTFTNKEVVTQKMGPNEMSQLLGISFDDVLLLYSYHYEHQRTNGAPNYEDVIADFVAWQIVQCPHKMSVQELVTFVVDNKATFQSMMDAQQLSQLEIGQKLINGTVSGESYTPNQMADILDMDKTQTKQIYLLYISKYGDTSGWKMSIKDFVNFVDSDVLPNPQFASFFDANTTEQLKSAKAIINAVVSGKKYAPKDLASLLGGVTQSLDANMVEILYLYNTSMQNSNPEWSLTIEELFRYISEDMIKDPRFASLINDELRTEINGMKTQLDNGVNQLLGKDYSLMMIETSLPTESMRTASFMRELTELLETNIDNQVYLIGNTPMSYEMLQSFDNEMLLITILTAVSIFIVVLFTFRSFLIPAILVLLVQCGVYVTMTVNGLMGYSIYYLAILIVQCILMGATIDYAILFTNYYRENRKTMDIQESLLNSYNGSIHTILTSGLIMVLVTGAIGISPVDPTISQICQTISIGALSAILLILFVLPGLIATFDKLIMKERKSKKKNKEIPVENKEPEV